MLVNNLDWLGALGLIEFLRDTGKHFTVPYMLAKDSVQVRLERGLSFTEFSYMLLQAYDYAHMYRTMGVELQMGGADQWGNITAGLELIRRTSGLAEDAEPAHGLAYKLLLTPSGTKFGKSEAGESVWLDPARTSPYAFYQYWLNVDDRDIGTYLRWFTEFPRERIEALEAEVAARPEARAAQRAMAVDITTRTHGEAATARAIADSEALFSAEPIVDPAVLASLYGSAGGFEFEPGWLEPGVAVLLAEAGVFASRGEARRMIAGGGVTINGVRVDGPGCIGRSRSPGSGSTSGSASAGGRSGAGGRRAGERYRAVTVAQRVDDGGRRKVALGEQDERVVQQVGRLAGERARAWPRGRRRPPGPWRRPWPPGGPRSLPR